MLKGQPADNVTTSSRSPADDSWEELDPPVQRRCSSSPVDSNLRETADDGPMTLLEKVDGSTVRCRLETQDLWDRFRQLGLTEMIITKAGR